MSYILGQWEGQIYNSLHVSEILQNNVWSSNPGHMSVYYVQLKKTTINIHGKRNAAEVPTL